MGIPSADLGDAPDSTNNHGQQHGLSGRHAGPLPHRLSAGTPAASPPGPVHVNVSVEAVLGDSITGSRARTTAADADGVNNILRTPGGAVADTADNDRADDGWRNRNVPILDCQRTTLVVRVRQGARRPVGEDVSQRLPRRQPGRRLGRHGHLPLRRRPTGPGLRVDCPGLCGGPERHPRGQQPECHSHDSAGPQPVPNAEAKSSHWMRFSSERAARAPQPGHHSGRWSRPPSQRHTQSLRLRRDRGYPLPADPQGQPGVLTLQKAVIVPSTPVGYADTVTYTIRLQTHGRHRACPGRDAGPAALSAPSVTLYRTEQSSQYVDVKELESGVSPLNAQLDYRYAVSRLSSKWCAGKGTLAPDAQVELSFRVHVHPLCQAGQSHRHHHQHSHPAQSRRQQSGRKSAALRRPAPATAWTTFR